MIVQLKMNHDLLCPLELMFRDLSISLRRLVVTSAEGSWSDAGARFIDVFVEIECNEEALAGLRRMQEQVNLHTSIQVIG